MSNKDIFMNNLQSKNIMKKNENEKNNDPMDDKKKNIWSLFSNVNVKLNEEKNDLNPIKTIFSPKNITLNESNKILENKNKGLFKNAQVNKSLLNEVSQITESYKRKNKILLSNNNTDNDNILSSIISTKKFKKTEEKTKPSHAYSEFFTPKISQDLTNEKTTINTNNNIIKDATNKLKDDYLKNKENKNILENKTKEANTIPIIKKNENITKTTLKKKNICVPTHLINEKQQEIIKKKPNRFHSNDKFDIFGKLNDDVLRYIILNIKNNGKLFTLNKRFCDMLRILRNKLIYDESLKNLISPESILKTIYSSENIEILDLSGCHHITSHHFSVLSNSNNIKFNKTLKVLCLKNCSKLTDSNLKILIQRFRNLKVLDIRNCYKISHEGIYPLKFRTTITKIYMGNIASSNASNAHSDESLKTLFGSDDEKTIVLESPLNKLVCFELANTKKLTDISNLMIIAKNLKILNLRGSSIDDSSAPFFKSFINLLALNLSNTKIANEVINTVINTSKFIKILDISNNNQITDKTIIEISKNLKEIRKIKISTIPNVDNFCIREMLKHLKHLISIDFSNCWRVSNTAFHINGLEIATQNLKEIGAYLCSVDTKVCEKYLSEVGCLGVRFNIYNEMKIFEASIYNDLEILEAI